VSPTVRDTLLLAVVAAALFLPWLGARDLWNPNEPVYGQAVAEMAARGEWLIPTVNGAVFAEKPILYFWMALGAARILGEVSEFALRLPSALAGIASVLLVGLLARPYAGRRRSVVAALLLATTFVVFWSARQVQMDLLLAACVLAAVLGATRSIDGLWTPARGWVLAGAAAGLGLLAKGPLGCILPALVVAGYAMITGRFRRAAHPALALGILACALVALPWYVLLWTRGETAFLNELLVRQNLTRFVEPWDHRAPSWYYLRYFWIDMAPWAWFVPLAYGLRPRDERERRLHVLAWTWVLVVVVFFSLSSSKRSPYILPAAPAVSLLVSGVVERWLALDLARWRVRALLALQCALGLGLLAAGALLAVGVPGLPQLPPEGAAAVRVTAAAFLLGGGLMLGGLLAAGRRTLLAPAAAVLALALVYAGAAAFALPAADAFKSARPLCEAIRSHVGPHAPLRGFHDWRWRAGYSFYLGRPIQNLETLDELREYWSRPERLYLIVERGRLDRAREVIGDRPPLASRAIGSNAGYLFSNHPE